MKKLAAVLLAGTVSVTFAAPVHVHKHVKRVHQKRDVSRSMEEKIFSMPYQDISEEEKNMLVNLRQEEKVARDVYLTLGKIYHTRVFVNIAKSEQRHMDAVKALLDKYGIEDPLAGMEDKVGEFQDETFTQLYNQLVEEGKVGLLEALIVGATIEDMDIHDIDEDLAKTDNEDIRFVFTNLRRGSTHHINAFVYNLKKQGYEYTPQYISIDEYNSIIKH